LNYYKVSYGRIQNLVFLNNFRENYKSETKDFKYPLLKAQLGFEPRKLITGNDKILKFLCENNFIFETKHITNSAEDMQSMEFATNILAKHLEVLFWSPILTFENLFKSAPENYRMGMKSYILMKAMRLHFQKIFKNVVINMYKSWTNRKEYRKAKQNVVEAFKEWGDRLGKKSFHGGKEPDEADFAVFAVIKTKYNSRSFQIFLERDCPDKVYTWLVRMQLLCKYDPERWNVVE